MKRIASIVAAACLAFSVTGAEAATLTFTGLAGTTYGSNNPLPPFVSGNGQFIAYTAGGYVVSLNTTNDPSQTFGAHIGDANYIGDTFDWHDGGDNLAGALVTLTRVGGGFFDLLSFNYVADEGLAVTAGAFPVLNLTAGSGSSTGFSNVNSVSFYGSGNNSLDNISVEDVANAVPEPATWALMIMGFGAIGGVMRRGRGQISTTVCYA